jgi:hypothetical protein
VHVLSDNCCRFICVSARQAIIDAAKKVGVKHIAFSSATGCDKKTAPSSHAAKKVPK